MANYKFTVFINGLDAANNYSRGNAYKITRLKASRKNINEYDSLELTVSGSTIADTNLVRRNMVYLFAGTNGSTADTLWYKFIIKGVKWKSDGVVILTCMKSIGKGGIQLAESDFDPDSTGTYNGTPTQILDNQSGGFIIRGEGATDEVYTVDASGATSKVTSFNIPRGTKNKAQAVKQYADKMGYEFDVTYSQTTTPYDSDTLVVSDNIGNLAISKFDLKTKNPNKNCLPTVEYEANDPITTISVTGFVKSWGDVRSRMSLTTDKVSNLSKALDTVLLGSVPNGGAAVEGLAESLTGDVGTRTDYIIVLHAPGTCSILDANTPGVDQGCSIVRIGDEFMLITKYKAIGAGEGVTTAPSFAPNAAGYMQIRRRGVNKYGNEVGTTFSLSKIREHPQGAEVLNWGWRHVTPDVTADNAIPITFNSITGWSTSAGATISIGDENFVYLNGSAGSTVYAKKRDDDARYYYVYGHFDGTRGINSAAGTGPASTLKTSGNYSYDDMDLEYRDQFDKYVQGIYDTVAYPGVVYAEPMNPVQFLATVRVGDKVTVTDARTNLSVAPYRWMGYDLTWEDGGQPNLHLTLGLTTVRSAGFDKMVTGESIIPSLFTNNKKNSDLAQGVMDWGKKLFDDLWQTGEMAIKKGIRLSFAGSSLSTLGQDTTIYRDGNDLKLQDPNTNSGNAVKLSDIYAAAGTYVLKVGDTMSGDLYLDDNTGVSPNIHLVNEANKEFKLYMYNDSKNTAWLSSEGDFEFFGDGNRMQFYLYGSTTHSTNEGWFRYLLPSSDDNSYFEIWDSGSNQLFAVYGDRSIKINGQTMGALSGTTFYDKPVTSTALGESAGVLGGMMAWANSGVRAAVEVYNDVTSSVMELMDTANAQTIGGVKTYTSDASFDDGSGVSPTLNFRNQSDEDGDIYFSAGAGGTFCIHSDKNIEIRSASGAYELILQCQGGSSGNISKVHMKLGTTNVYSGFQISDSSSRAIFTVGGHGVASVYDPTNSSESLNFWDDGDAWLYAYGNGDLYVGNDSGTYLNFWNNGTEVGYFDTSSDLTVNGCVYDATCEVMTNLDAVSIIKDVLSKDDGTVNALSMRHMDMPYIHSKYPFLVKREIKETKNLKSEERFYDKLGAKSDLCYAAISQIDDRLKAIEDKLKK